MNGGTLNSTVHIPRWAANNSILNRVCEAYVSFACVKVMEAILQLGAFSLIHAVLTIQ